MTIDHHVYLDESYYNVNNLNKLLLNSSITNAVISPPCTKVSEPEKSELMYFIQRKLLMNRIGFNLSKIISNSFYNEKNELKSFWKFFSNNQNLIKVIYPNNLDIYKKIEKYKNFKMWYWINPNTNLFEEDLENITKFKNKIYGIKFHQYWHKFNLKDTYKYLDIIHQNNFKTYLILDYINTAEIQDFINIYKKNKVIFGYGGFPLFYRVWPLINNNTNCYIDIASNHIDKNIIFKIFKYIESNKILFSSDCPYNFKDENNNFSYYKFINRHDFLSTNLSKNLINNSLK